MKLNVTRLTEVSKKIKEKHPEAIHDIILFGSSVRGKESPGDIDILILFKDEVNKDIEYSLRKALDEEVDITSKTVEGFRDESFLPRDSVFFEGYSLINEKNISAEYGYASIGLFLYQTGGLSNTEKTRFYYALNGRNGSEGMMDKLEGFRISDNLIAVPLESIERAKDFFDQWDVKYKYIPTLLPQRMAKERILKYVR